MSLHWHYNEREFVTELKGLQDGESRELDLDLARMVLASVKGRVTLNGRPAVGSVLTLHTDAKENAKWHNFKLNSKARYEAKIVPANYKITLQLKVADRRSIMIPGAGLLLVTPGQTIERDLAFHAGDVRIVVVLATELFLHCDALWPVFRRDFLDLITGQKTGSVKRTEYGRY